MTGLVGLYQPPTFLEGEARDKILSQFKEPDEWEPVRLGCQSFWEKYLKPNWFILLILLALIIYLIYRYFNLKKKRQRKQKRLLRLEEYENEAYREKINREIEHSLTKDLS